MIKTATACQEKQDGSLARHLRVQDHVARRETQFGYDSACFMFLRSRCSYNACLNNDVDIVDVPGGAAARAHRFAGR